MIPGIRLATPEEIEQIKDHADLTPSTRVWAWPNPKGQPDLAVIRNCMEIDPMFFAETSGNQRKALFGWGLFNVIRANGVPEIYCQVDAEGYEDYIEILKKMGAQATTTKPQYRFKVVL